ncbi:MAG: tetratricopeptide repeat protein [Alphaproteobacteria bacterium]
MQTLPEAAISKCYGFMGISQFKLGNYAAAISSLSNALLTQGLIANDRANATYHLGASYYMIGQYDTAIDVLKDVLSDSILSGEKRSNASVFLAKCYEKSDTLY